MSIMPAGVLPAKPILPATFCRADFDGAPLYGTAGFVVAALLVRLVAGFLATGVLTSDFFLPAMAHSFIDADEPVLFCITWT